MCMKHAHSHTHTHTHKRESKRRKRWVKLYIKNKEEEGELVATSQSKSDISFLSFLSSVGFGVIILLTRGIGSN